MKSLFILCVGGRGEPMLAAGVGGGMEPKKCDKLKVGLLLYIPSTKYFLLVDKKNVRNKRKKIRQKGKSVKSVHIYSVGLSQNVTVTAWEHQRCTLNCD